MDVVLGAVYRTGNEDFVAISNVPIELEINQDETYNIKINRWRFLIGFNLSLSELIRFIPGKGEENDDD